ncbi:MAG: hypothetical protein QOH79_260 [Acidimicrobiaceae bacterium]
MSIRARSTRRGTVYDVRLREPRTGQEMSRTFTTRRDAVTWEAEQRAAKSRGSWISPRVANSLTLNELAKEWLAMPGKRGSSIARDEIALEHHILPTLGECTLGSLTTSDVQRLVNDWSTHLAPSTVQRTFSVLRAVLNFAIDRELIVRSPCRKVRLPSAPRRHREMPTTDRLAKLAEAVGPDYSPMVWLGAVAGLRWAEAAGLRVKHVDFLRSTVTVAEQWARGRGGKESTSEPKSSAGRRTMTMPKPLMDMLTEHLTRKNLTGADADAFVFTAASGDPLHYTNWRRRVWVPATKKAGLEGLGFHDLLRANATALVAEGVDVKTAQLRLGHANPNTTLAIYAQGTTEADRSAADKLSKRFFPDTINEERGMDAG